MNELFGRYVAMKWIYKRKLVLFGVLCIFVGLALAQENSYPNIYATAETVAGKLELIALDNEKREIRLGNKLLLQVGSNEALDTTKLSPYLSVLAHIKQPISPFDEVVVIGSQAGNAHCWGTGVLLIGLRKDGTYKLTHLGRIMADEPTIQVVKGAIKITVQSAVHSTSYTNWPMPGGRWLYKNGKLHRIKGK